MIAFLFPGQGSQRPGLLKGCIDDYGARELFLRASAVLNIDVLQDDDSAALEDTAIVQRNIFLAGLAAARCLESFGVVPGIVAGHSIGAFAAAAFAGIITFEDALELVRLRGSAMASALGAGYGMGAVLGLSERDVRSIVSEVRANEIVDVSGINAIDQIVVSGTCSGVDRVLTLATIRGARDVRRLSVPTASHTSLLRGVRDQLHVAFQSVTLHTPRFAVAGNIDGRALFTASDIAWDLTESVAQPVRWFDATQMLDERGATCFVECFPGDTLTTLIESAFPNATALSLGRSGLEATVHLGLKYG